MPSPRTKPSWTSLIALSLIVLPILYLLSHGLIAFFWDDIPQSLLDTVEPAYAWVGGLDEESLIGRVYFGYIDWCYELGDNQS